VLRAVEAEARCFPTVVRRQGGREVCHVGGGWCVPVGGGCHRTIEEPSNPPEKMPVSSAAHLLHVTTDCVLKGDAVYMVEMERR